MSNSGLWRAARPGAHVEPSTIRVRDEFVLREFGEEAQGRVRAALSPPARAIAASATPPAHFVELAYFVEMNVAVERELGSGDFALVRRMGRYAAHHNAGIWRSIFQRGVDIPTFLGIAAGLWHKHYDSGSLDLRQVDDDTVEIEIKGFAAPHRTHCVSVVGWLEGIFELDPRHRVTVDELHCRASGDPRCVICLRYSANEANAT